MSEACPPCKIIIDGGFTSAAASLLANTVGPEHQLYRVALFLADVVTSSVDSVSHALKSRAIDAGQEMTFSFDGCHRATEILAWVDALDADMFTEENAADANQKMLRWAHDEYARTVALVAGVKE